MKSLQVAILSIVVSLSSGCLGGTLHYSKFQSYRVVDSADTVVEKNISFTISNPTYSQRWRYKYYVVMSIYLNNTGSDTVIFNKAVVSLEVKADSFYITDNYTSKDDRGQHRDFKVFKLSNVYKIPPQTSMIVPYQFLSHKKYSENEYQKLYADTLMVSLNNQVRFKLVKKERG